MTNQTKSDDEPARISDAAQKAAEAAYSVGKKAYERADEKLDELSKFGKQQPLLAMGIAFIAGCLFAKIFVR